MEGGKIPVGEKIINHVKPGDVSMQFRKTVVIMTFMVISCVSVNGFSENEFLKVDPDIVDFDTIEEGKPAATTVTVKNTGTSTVEITNVRTN